ncbi:MAG: hypothetical protein ABI321_01415 [Polyangia bacterium]
MGLAFGTDDDLTCLTGNFMGPHDTQVCLASKISLHFFGAGIYVSDGGYVLKVQGEKSYYSLSPERIEQLQQAHAVPTPLPPYHVSVFQYAFGYSLWIIVVGMFIAAGAKRVFGKLRPFLADPVAPTLGPPEQRTDGDRWLSSELGTYLEPGERLFHQAVGANHEPGTVVKGGKFFYVGFTDRRLLLLEASRGLRGMKHETLSFVAHARTSIVAVGSNQLGVGFDFDDAPGLSLWIFGSQRQYTNQWRFARDVPRLVQEQLTRAAA